MSILLRDILLRVACRMVLSKSALSWSSTSKLGTRGSVYEVYLIQELNRKPIAKKGKAFIRLGYQYYKFDYTNSNNWVGAPDAIGTANPQMFTQIKDASDLYATFEVQF